MNEIMPSEVKVKLLPLLNRLQEPESKGLRQTMFERDCPLKTHILSQTHSLQNSLTWQYLPKNKAQDDNDLRPSLLHCPRAGPGPFGPRIGPGLALKGQGQGQLLQVESALALLYT